MKKLTLKQIEERLNEAETPDHDHPDSGGRVPWGMENRYGSWLRRNDSIAFEIAARELRG